MKPSSCNGHNHTPGGGERYKHRFHVVTPVGDIDNLVHNMDRLSEEGWEVVTMVVQGFAQSALQPSQPAWFCLIRMPWDTWQAKKDAAAASKQEPRQELPKEGGGILEG